MAKSADLARAELEARIAPRTLLVAQREYIGRTLRPFARQFFGRRVKLDWSLSDVEPTIFAIELEDSLKRAGIEVERPTAITLGGGIKIGIGITGPARDGIFIRRLYFILNGDFPRESIVYEASAKYDGLPVTITVGVKTPLGIETLPVPTVAATLPQEVSKPDRHLTREQQSLTARQLRPFIGQRAMFVLPPGDREAAGIANDIDAALNVARWIRSSGRPQNVGRLRGILIEVNRSATARDLNAAEWLATTLRDDRLDVIGPIQSNQAARFQIAPIIITIGRNQ
jgi:hypothetical protein